MEKTHPLSGIRFRFACVALTAVLLTIGCSCAPPRPTSFVGGDYGSTREYLSALIRKEMRKHDVTGLSIALVDDQRIVWEEGFGFADKAGKVKATPETVYRVGSISKLFTATAVMQFSERGEMDIDRPLSRYLPGFSIRSRFPDAGPVTPRNIMTHHSGLPSDLLKGMWSKNPEPFESDIDNIRDMYAPYPPGLLFSYSNLGVTLLGHAVEKVAGRDFAAQADLSILRPLGMKSSRFETGVSRSPSASKAYRDGREVEEPPLRDVPAGGLNSTVRDLSLFMQMVFAGGRAGEFVVLKPETLTEMLRPQNDNVPLDLDFRTGLGWALGGLGDIDIRNAGTVAHHSGATIYHRAMLAVLPEHKLGVVVLANASGAGPVVSKVAAEALKLASEAKSGIRQPDKEKIGAGRANDEELSAFEGTFATMAGVARVSKISDRLKADVAGISLSLDPRKDGLFGMKYRLLGLIPIRLGELDAVGLRRSEVAGREVIAARMSGRELLVGERIHPTGIPEAWRKRTGEYEIANAGEDFVMFRNVRLRTDGGLLLMDLDMPALFQGRLSFALDPISDTETVVRGLGRGMGETIRVVERGGTEMVEYSGYFLKKK